MKKTLLILSTSLFTNILSLTTIACTFRHPVTVETYKYTTYFYTDKITVGNLQKHYLNIINNFFEISTSDVISQAVWNIDNNSLASGSEYVTPGSNFKIIFTSQLKIDYELVINVALPDDLLTMDEVTHVINGFSVWTEGIRTLSMQVERNKYTDFEAFNLAIGEYLLYYQWSAWPNNPDYKFYQDVDHFAVDKIAQGDFYNDGTDVLNSYEKAKRTQNYSEFTISENTPYILQLTADFINDPEGVDTFNDWKQADTTVVEGYICITVNFV